MRLSENIYSRFDTCDIQFCTGIAVSYELGSGSSKIAKQIIHYKTHKYYNIRGKVFDNPEVKEKLDAERREIEESISRLAETENLNSDYAAVKWFCTEPILKVSKRSSMHSGFVMMSVVDYVKSISIDTVYERVMKMLITTRRNHLIVHYIPTTMFAEPFKTAMSMAINNRLRDYSYVRRLGDADFAELRIDFERIYRRDLTQSSEPFHPITGDPDSALCGDPIKLWYVNNKRSKFQSVVFGRGQEMETDEGSVSRLNLRETDDNTNVTEIDFVGLCTKIYAASSILFTHKDVLVYDIFSHHCDRMLDGRIADFRKNCANVYKGITFETSSQSIGECINDTHRGKIVDRLKYADFLDRRFSYSVTIQDLNDICNQLYRITEDVKPVDGHRLFGVDGGQVYQNTTESQRFEILFSGYKSLYKLINYIKRNEGRTGVSINDFPITIFRDPIYLKRFRTFDDYISGHDIVKQLIDDIADADDDARRSQKFNGIYNNEMVGEILASKKSIKYIKEFAMLGEKSVSFMSDVTHKKAHESEDEILAASIVRMVGNLNDVFGEMYPFIKSKTYNKERSIDNIPYQWCLMLIEQIARNNYEYLCAQEPDKEWYFGQSAYASALIFFYLLERVQKEEGVPIADSDGFFAFSISDMQVGINGMKEKCDNAINRISCADGMADSEKQKSLKILQNTRNCLVSTYVYRMMNFIMYFDMFYNKKLMSNDIKELTDDDIHTMYYSYSIIKKYLDSSYDILFSLKNHAHSNLEDVTRPARQRKMMAENMFRLSMELADKLDILNIPKHVTSELDLGCLCTSDLALYMDKELLEGSREASKRNDARKEKMVIAFNRMLATFHDIPEFFAEISGGVKCKLDSTSKESVLGISDLMDKLELLNREILCDSFIYTDECQRASQLIKANASQFNEYGFMMKSGDLIFEDFGLYKKYFHRKGMACKIYSDFSKLEHAVLSDDDRQFLLSI